jgi:hypothetical protein
MKRGTLWWALAPLAALSMDLALAEPMKGYIVGEKCAKLGKIGECYLKWADPMVFWTQDGDYYRIELVGKDLDQVSLDQAYGQEVQLEATVVKKGAGNGTVQVSKLALLNPRGKKEFFKG